MGFKIPKNKSSADEVSAEADFVLTKNPSDISMLSGAVFDERLETYIKHAQIGTLIQKTADDDVFRTYSNVGITLVRSRDPDDATDDNDGVASFHIGFDVVSSMASQNHNKGIRASLLREDSYLEDWRSGRLKPLHYCGVSYPHVFNLQISAHVFEAATRARFTAAFDPTVIEC